jgi:hypothetical protein
MKSDDNVNFSVKVLDSTGQCRKPCCWQSIAPAWPVPRLLGCGSHLPTIDDKVVLTPALRSGVAGTIDTKGPPEEGLVAWDS